MNLAGRLTAFFLAALALVLAGFSAAVFLLANVYLNRQLDERLQSALNTLVAIAEVEEGGLEWDLHNRTMQVGGLFPDGAVQWSVHAAEGRLLDSSPGRRHKDPLQRDIDPSEPTDGRLSEKQLGEDWRGLRRTLIIDTPPVSKPSLKPLHGKLIFTVAASEKALHALLQWLAATLALTSAGVWLIALVVGRRFCRRALRPVTAMAEQARTMNAEDHGEQLEVPPTHDELEALGLAFNGLIDRLHEALERQRRFTGQASHQLRTPLAGLLGQVEVALRHSRTPEEYRQTLEHVRQQGQHLQRIVEMLLYLARADAEARLEDFTTLDLTDWLPEHLESWSAHSRWRDLLMASHVSGSCPVKAQGPLLGQLLDNLLDNAFKYSDAGSLVMVGLKIEDGQAILTVKDRGIGLAEKDLPHVFEPFYRAEAARGQAYTGVGLGLSIAQRIAHLFKGRLEVSRNVGIGSRFSLGLPLQQGG